MRKGKGAIIAAFKGGFGMKVNGGGSAGPVGPAGGRPKAGGSGFSVSLSDAASAGAPAAPVAGASAVSSVDALLALQEYPASLEKRRRAVKRATRLLDHLDEVKIAILDSVPTDGALERLSQAVREARIGTDDEKLDGVLNEIETRAAVELAKREVAARAS
jgi:hypothetical protein